jgi:transposase-like protein
MRQPTSTTSTAALGRPCTICHHRLRAEIEQGIEMGVTISALAERFDFSKSAGYRHVRLHLHPEIPTGSANVYADQPSNILGRLVEVADDLRNMRRAAVSAGNTLSAARTATAEIRALSVMADRLGIENLDVLDTLTQVSDIARAFVGVGARYPEAGDALVSALEARGKTEAADNLRTALEGQRTEMAVK